MHHKSILTIIGSTCYGNRANIISNNNRYYSSPLAANLTIIDAQQEQQQHQLPTNQSVVTQNRTRLFESIEDSFRLQVPEGWVIHDVNNTSSSALSEESTQGYGILAQLCPQEE